MSYYTSTAQYTYIMVYKSVGSLREAIQSQTNFFHDTFREEIHGLPSIGKLTNLLCILIMNV
jgi:hypothetical protein